MDHVSNADEPRRNINQILARIAQDGVITLPRAAAASVTPRMLQSRAANGSLVRDAPGVYRLPGAQLRGATAERSALAATGSPGLALWSANAALVGGTQASKVHVLVRYPSKFQSTSWFTAHPTRRLTEDELTTRNGLALTTMARTIRDFAAFLPHENWADWQLNQYIEQAVIAKALTLSKLEIAIERERAPHLRRRLERALEYHQGNDPAVFRSIGEEWLRDLINRRSLPMPQFNVRAAGGKLAEADAWFPDIPLIIEFDGFTYHHTRTKHDADRRRDRRALRHGIPTLRITKTDFELDRSELEDDIEAIVTGAAPLDAFRHSQA